MSSTQQQVSVPKSLQFTEQDIIEASQKVRISRGGMYAGVLSGVENTVSQNTWFPMFKLTWWPLSDVSKPETAQKSMAMNSYVVLPFVTEDVQRRYSPAEITVKKSQYTDMMVRNLRGIFGEEMIPAYPVYNRDQKAYFWNGSSLGSKDEAEEIRKDINKKAYTLANKLWDDPNLWVSPHYRGAYLLVKMNDNGYPNVDAVFGEKPADKELVPFAKWFEPEE
jgi:hypothetical protein